MRRGQPFRSLPADDSVCLEGGCGHGPGARARGESEIHIYPSTNAGKSMATVAGGGVNDLAKVVDALASKGLNFERTTRR